MAIDLSKLSSVVNNYLYSISDVNGLLSAASGEGAGSDLTGIFQKYLTKALEDEVSGSNSNMTQEEVDKALTDLKSLSAGLNTGTSSDNEDSMFTSSLPDLTGLGALSSLTSTNNLNSSTNLLSLLTTLNKVSDSESSKSASETQTESKENNTQNNAIAEQIAGTFTSLNLEAEIEGAFSGMNLEEQIKSKIANRDITGEINKSIENLDIKGDIQRSIASHDRSDEINSYNATRLKNYKKQATGTSVFGEYRL